MLGGASHDSGVNATSHGLMWWCFHSTEPRHGFQILSVEEEFPQKRDVTCTTFSWLSSHLMIFSSQCTRVFREIRCHNKRKKHAKRCEPMAHNVQHTVLRLARMWSGWESGVGWRVGWGGWDRKWETCRWGHDLPRLALNSIKST